MHSRRETQLSPALGELVAEYRALKPEIEHLQAEVKRLRESEAHAKVAFKKAEARAFLEADGPQEERKRKALLETVEAFTSWQVDEGLRHGFEAALSAQMEQLDFLKATAHAHNRELKTLGG